MPKSQLMPSREEKASGLLAPSLLFHFLLVYLQVKYGEISKTLVLNDWPLQRDTHVRATKNLLSCLRKMHVQFLFADGWFRKIFLS